MRTKDKLKIIRNYGVVVDRSISHGDTYYRSRMYLDTNTGVLWGYGDDSDEAISELYTSLEAVLLICVRRIS